MQTGETGMKTLICVDVQPFYQEYICFNPRKVGKLAKKFDRVIVFFNGDDVGIEDTEYEVSRFLGLRDAKFIPKGYGFFRDPMDSGEDIDSIVERVIRLSHIQKPWEHPDLEDLRYPSDLAESLDRIRGDIYTCGGAADACLLEIEILLASMKYKFERIEEVVYY